MDKRRPTQFLTNLLDLLASIDNEDTERETVKFIGSLPSLSSETISRTNELLVQELCKRAIAQNIDSFCFAVRESYWALLNFIEKKEDSIIVLDRDRVYKISQGELPTKQELYAIGHILVWPPERVEAEYRRLFPNNGHSTNKEAEQGAN